jgi:3-oxoadipate enol-lactonase
VPTDIRGQRFAWREAGLHIDSEGQRRPVVVLLHGLGGSRISWESQLLDFRDRFRVVAWDLPGYGDSPDLNEPMTFEALANAVVNFIDEIGTDSAHLVGISFGGMIAQYVASQHPARIRSLTLLSTSPKFGLDGTDPDAWRAARLAALDVGQQPSDFAEPVLRSLAGPNIGEHAFNEQKRAMGRITAIALRRSIDCLVTHDSRDLLAMITAPTLCLVGEFDRETPISYSQAIVDAISGARLRVITNAGHLLNAEAPDAVNDAIGEHIAAVERLADDKPDRRTTNKEPKHD